MKLSSDEKKALIAYRKNKAFETFKEAEGISKLGYWNTVANRLYYAGYYMVSALLIQNDLYSRTHSGAIRLFGLNFVTTNLVDSQLGRFYSRLFEMRQTGDYDDLYELTEEDVKPLIKQTEQFLNSLSGIIESSEF